MEIVFRATILYFFVFVLVRSLGKRELSEISAFELLLLVTMGDLIQQGVTQEDYSVTGAMLAVGTMGVWVLVFSFTSFKSKGARRVLEGVPLIVVKDGRPIESVLHNERIPLDDLFDAAREQGIGNLQDITVGVLEPDGKFSFITQTGHRPPGGQEHKAE